MNNEYNKDNNKVKKEIEAISDEVTKSIEDAKSNDTINNNYNMMTDMPIKKLIIKLAIPTIISMLVSSIYNLVDAYFVGKINTSASAAVGVILGLQAILQAFGFMFGHGSGSIISRKLGEKDEKSASMYASTSFFATLIIGMIISLIGILFLTPCLSLLGSTKTILPYAKQYGISILVAAPFFVSSCVLNNIMRYEGKAALAMVGLTSGSILNMILDPILMFGLNLDTFGAGLATAISQVVSFALLLYMFLSGRTKSKLAIKNANFTYKNIKHIVTTGFPSLIRQGLNSISTMVLNNAAAGYTDAAISAMTIVGRISMFVASMLIGVGQGLQPVVGHNYGAKKPERVREAFKFTVTVGEILMFIFAAVGLFAGEELVGLFRDDADVIRIGSTALKYYCIALIFQPVGVCANMTFQSMGKSGIASFISILRSGLYFIPTLLIMPRIIGLTGIQSAQAVADVLTFITALPIVVIKLFRNKSLEDRRYAGKL